jgi:hypothetical protein
LFLHGRPINICFIIGKGEIWLITMIHRYNVKLDPRWAVAKLQKRFSAGLTHLMGSPADTGTVSLHG